MQENNHVNETCTNLSQMAFGFNSLRKKLVANQRIFTGLVLLFFLLILSLFINQIFGVIKNDSFFPLFGGLICSFVTCVFGFFNYRIKIGIHDILTNRFELGPPPPSDKIIEMIIQNSYFRPIKNKH